MVRGMREKPQKTKNADETPVVTGFQMNLGRTRKERIYATEGITQGKNTFFETKYRKVYSSVGLEGKGRNGMVKNKLWRL